MDNEWRKARGNVLLRKRRKKSVRNYLLSFGLDEVPG